MKDTTAATAAMTDAELNAEFHRLRALVPANQSKLDAIKREVRRRKRAK